MKILSAMAILLLLAACGSEQSAQENTPAGADHSAGDSERAPTVGKEIADDLNSSLERARAVEEQALQQKRKIDEALQDAQGDP